MGREELNLPHAREVFDWVGRSTWCLGVVGFKLEENERDGVLVRRKKSRVYLRGGDRSRNKRRYQRIISERDATLQLYICVTLGVTRQVE